MIFLFLAVLGAVVILKATMDAAVESKVGGHVGGIMENLNNQSRPTESTLSHAAQLLTEQGYHQTAEALRDKADIAHAIATVPTELPSPLPGVDVSAWRAFVNLFKGSDVGEVSPSYQFGLFNIGFRRLADLGLASGVHRGTYQKRSVWFGKFIAPLTVELFLSDPSIQYRVFCLDMKDRHKLVTRTHHESIGKPLEGVSVSLSGLLAVAKMAGTAGLASWLTDEAERKKFSQTTAAFKAANGIF